MYRAALRSMLSELLREERLLVVDALAIDQPKTRDLVTKLKAMSLDHVLLVVEQHDEKLWLAARNIAWVEVMTAGEIDPLSLVRFDKVLATSGAVRSIEERLS
jgi:large subunit ribosomal protein L4